MYADYLEDLSPYALSDINDAIKKYRQSEEKFFPTCGALVKIIRTIPSWDVRSPNEHAKILRETARKELEGVMAKIEARKLQALPSAAE